MTRLLLVYMCLCCVSSFKIFPLNIQDDVVTTESVIETVVFTNLPTAPEKVVETTSDSSSSSDFTTASTIDEAPISSVPVASSNPTESSSDINSSPNPTVLSKNPILVIQETQSSPESVSDSIATRSTNLNTASITSNHSEPLKNLSESASDSVAQSESTQDSNLSESEVSIARQSETEQSANNLPESTAAPVQLSKSTKALTVQSGSEADSASQSESKKPLSSLSESATESKLLSEPTKVLTNLSDPEADTASESESASLSKAETSSHPSNSADSSSSLTEISTSSTESPDESNSSNSITTSSVNAATDSTGPSSTEADLSLFETTTEDLSFLSLDLLPPKTEYRSNEPDPRYDY